MVNSDLEAIWRKMAGATVRLRIEIGLESGVWEYGTAFMVSPELAVTADHNQPEAVRQGRINDVEAVFVDHVASPVSLKEGFSCGRRI